MKTPMVGGPSRLIPFWAVMDPESATKILRELSAGHRARAYRLLEELAFSLGSQAN